MSLLYTLSNHAEGTSLEDSDAYSIKYTYEDQYEVALMSGPAKDILLPPNAEGEAVIVDMGEGKEQRAFLYADIASMASTHLTGFTSVSTPGSRQSESLPASRKSSVCVISRQLSKSNIQVLRMNSQSDLAQKLAQLIRTEQLNINPSE